MNLNQMFKSIIDLDEMAVVICDINHIIVYMNSAAIKKYEKRGGDKLLGKNLLDCHNERSCEIIKNIIEKSFQDINCNKIYTYHNSRDGVNQDAFIVAIRDENGTLIGYYEKFENRNVYANE